MKNKLNCLLEVLNQWKGNEDAILQDGTQLICRINHESPLGYLHKIYPPLGTMDIEKIEVILKINLPIHYLDFLLMFNGLDIFNGDIAIFGLKKGVGHFNRFFQPYDIILENLRNKMTDNCFLFAYYKQKYNVYFSCEEKGKVIIKKSETNEFVREFPSFLEWIEQSINGLSRDYAELKNKLVE